MDKNVFSSIQPVSCPKCGRELKPNSRFCPKCGAQIDNSSSISSQTEKESINAESHEPAVTTNLSSDPLISASPSFDSIDEKSAFPAVNDSNEASKGDDINLSNYQVNAHEQTNQSDPVFEKKFTPHLAKGGIFQNISFPGTSETIEENAKESIKVITEKAGNLFGQIKTVSQNNIQAVSGNFGSSQGLSDTHFPETQNQGDSSEKESVCRCGYKVPAGTNFCPKCGSPISKDELIKDQIPSQQICQKCGTPLADGALFCPKCGTKRGEESGYSEVKPVNKENPFAVLKKELSNSPVQRISAQKDIAKEKIKVFESIVKEVENDTPSVFAHTLPEWSIEPPFIPVERRKM